MFQFFKESLQPIKIYQKFNECLEKIISVQKKWKRRTEYEKLYKQQLFNEFSKQINPTYFEMYKKYNDANINVELEVERQALNPKIKSMHQSILNLAKSVINEYIATKKITWGMQLQKYRMNLQKAGISISEKSGTIRRWLHLYEQIRNLINGLPIEEYKKSEFDPPELYSNPTQVEIKAMIIKCLYQKELFNPTASPISQKYKYKK